MKIVVGCDHGGFLLKEKIVAHLKEQGMEVTDVGCFSLDSVDYPDFAHKASELVENKQVDFGIVVCTSGEGVSITANKHKGVRCGLAYNLEVSELMRRHNNANMIAIGAKYIKEEDALQFVDKFLETPFDGGRHERRVNKIER